MQARVPGAAPADRSNWRTPPHSRWALNHVDAIMPCARIRRGIGAALALPAAPAAWDAFRLDLADGSALDLPGYLAATATDALVVLHDGRIVLEHYAGAAGPATPHILMSASKSLVGLLAGILERRGRLDLDAPVSDHVPEIATTAYGGARLRHLLDMRAGVTLDATAQRAYAVATNWEAEAPAGPGQSLHAFLARLPAADRPHGGAFRYVSANTDLLGWAIERATGESFATLLGALLWAPMGAEADAFVTLDIAGAARCTGGIAATARDLARIGQLMVRDGRRDGVEVIPPAWLDDIAENGDHAAWRDGDFAPSFPGMAMRYRGGWYVIDDAPKTLFAMGIHGQNLFVDRDNRLVVAKLSSQAEAIDRGATALTHRALRAIRRCLLG